jgi:small subunit ribosomal protein S1
MADASVDEKKLLKATDASGREVDLSEFEEDFYTPDQVEKALQDYNKSLDGLEEGQVVRGRILRITAKEVIVDVNFKSEGIIPLSEFKNVQEFKSGDEIDVFLEQVEDNEGQIILSKSRADFLRVWDRIFDAFEKQETIEGRVMRRIKGGVVVDLFGVDAFLPGSQIDLRQIPDMDAILGQTFKFRVIKVNKARRNIVVSRRVILEEDRSQMRGKILTELEKGQVREGTVKNITDFGAFIDLGGVDGLLHITDMSWGRVNHPSEIVALGDKLKVKVLDFNENKERISLGLKQLSEHPWKGIEDKFPEGAHVRGKIVSITDYGAFMELEKGIEGLIHISEMSWTQHIKHPSKIVGVGDIVEAVVLKVDKVNQKISLGIKQLEPDPWEKVPADFRVGDIVSGKVRNLAAFGAFVELKEGIDGLIHISDMSWTKKVNHPGELVKKGDTVEVKVLDIDLEKRRISLGIKQLTGDPWPNLVASFPVGTEIADGEVARILDRGVVVNLGNEVEGFIPLNQLGQDTNHPSRIYKVGDKVPSEVIEFDLEGRKIVLSIEEYFKDKQDAWKEHVAAFPVKAAVESKGGKGAKSKKQEGGEGKAAVEKKEKSSEDEADTTNA